MNRCLAWFVALPLGAAGMLVAHEVGWSSSAAEHATPHGHYLAYAAILAAIAAAALIAVATSQLIRGISGADWTIEGSTRVFAAVPIVGFVLQEHLEHLVAGHELQPAIFLSAPFLFGLALQLPFAFAALAVARVLLTLVTVVVRALRGELTLVPPGVRRTLVPCAAQLPPCPVLATRHAGRAPPSPR